MRKNRHVGVYCHQATVAFSHRCIPLGHGLLSGKIQLLEGTFYEQLHVHKIALIAHDHARPNAFKRADDEP